MVVRRYPEEPLEIFKKRQMKEKKKDINVEELFDKNFKPGDKVAMAKKERKTGKDKMIASFSNLPLALGGGNKLKKGKNGTQPVG